MMRVCSLNTCPVGIATQDERLKKRFKGKREHIVNLMRFIAQEMREIMAELGFRTVDEMIGHSDYLAKRVGDYTDRTDALDYTELLNSHHAYGPHCHFNPGHPYHFHLEKTLDEMTLVKNFLPYMEKRQPHQEHLPISSTNRSFGTIFGSEITKRFGDRLKEDTYVIHATGGAGQSMGAFLPCGVTIRLSGDANDGVGKGLSGGKLVITPPEGSPFQSQENIIIGNVALYGATSGKAFISGIAGERFCVRNSGATAVVEGCGDHGLEYMTGGRVVVLGSVGKNFAAGMSGGIAYVLDRHHTLYLKLNKDMVDMSEVTEKYDKQELYELISQYYEETHSKLAGEILADFSSYLPSFKKIIPYDYSRMIRLISHFEEQGISHENATLEAFKKMHA